MNILDTPEVLPQPGLFAWHFLPDNGHMRRYDQWGDSKNNGSLVRAGKTYTVEGPVACCKRGLHASVKARHALYFAPGGILERVWVSGGVDVQADKVAATHRACLWIADARPVLHEFAIWCAEQAVEASRARGEEPYAAIAEVLEAKRKWLRDELSVDELTTIRDKAWEAHYKMPGTPATEVLASALYAAMPIAHEAAAVAANRAGDAAWLAAYNENAVEGRMEARRAVTDLQNAHLTPLLMALAPAGYVEAR